MKKEVTHTLMSNKDAEYFVPGFVHWITDSAGSQKLHQEKGLL